MPAAELPAVTVTGDRSVTIDGYEIQLRPAFGGGGRTKDQIALIKPPHMVESYRDLLARHRGGRIVELGIAHGGSAALIALIARPARLVAVELATERVDLLDQLLRDRGLEDQVHPHYGVDQSDRTRLSSIVEDEFDGPLDLVVDDASHLYEHTVASFEVLFPRVRPGGEYVIEDWSADHLLRLVVVAALDDEDRPGRAEAVDVLTGRRGIASDGRRSAVDAVQASLPGGPDVGDIRPLSQLTARLALGPAEPGSGIESVTITPEWTLVRRSEEPLDPATYSLEGTCPDHFGILAGGG